MSSNPQSIEQSPEQLVDMLQRQHAIYDALLRTNAVLYPQISDMLQPVVEAAKPETVEQIGKLVYLDDARANRASETPLDTQPLSEADRQLREIAAAKAEVDAIHEGSTDNAAEMLRAA